MKEFLEIARESVWNQIAALKKGIPRSTFTFISEELEIPQKRLAEVLGLNERTLRSRGARLNEVESEKSLRVGRVYVKAIDVLGSPERARKWISAPIKSLGNKCPLDYLETDIGTGEVMNVLNAIEWGVYL